MIVLVTMMLLLVIEIPLMFLMKFYEGKKMLLVMLLAAGCVFGGVPACSLSETTEASVGLWGGNAVRCCRLDALNALIPKRSVVCWWSLGLEAMVRCFRPRMHLGFTQVPPPGCSSRAI